MSSPKENKKRDEETRSKSATSSTPRSPTRSKSPTRSSTPRTQSRKSTRASTARSDTSSRYTYVFRKQTNPNKIYRCPPTPPPDDHFQLEKSFVLDSNAVSSISADYSKTNPKLGPVVSPYNSQRDRSARGYFRNYGVDNTLRRTGQERPGTSIEGRIQDRFQSRGPGFLYLARRNVHGAGRSLDVINGHSEFLTDIRPIFSYNGPYGYRRNTPWLRACPSPFGTGRSAIY